MALCAYKLPCFLFLLVTSPLVTFYLIAFYFLLTTLLLPPCYLTTFPLLPYYFLLTTLLLSPYYLTTYYFLLPTLLLSPYYLTTSSLLLITFSLLPSPFYLEKATTPSPFIPSINMRKGCSKHTCLTCCVSSTAGMASRMSLRKSPSGMLVSIVK